ncbi:MAG: hypothetical protein J5I81_15215 [Nitrococcus mobilis]|nr:hypothetical protein [Nitrococcus mobilis]
MNLTRWFRHLAVIYTGGVIGGLANSTAVWLCGLYGVTARLAVDIQPAFTPAWLYPRLVWGGIWGFLFLLPYRDRSIVIRGLLYSLAPSLVQLLYVFPFQQGAGWFGVQLGNWTFLFVFLSNAVWGLVAAAVILAIAERRDTNSPPQAAAGGATETAE